MLLTLQDVKTKDRSWPFATYSMNLVEGDYCSRKFCIQYNPPRKNEVRLGGQNFVNSKYNNFSLDCVFVRRGYKTTVRESQIIGL